jgi:hypothetical protein
LLKERLNRSSSSPSKPFMNTRLLAVGGGSLLLLLFIACSDASPSAGSSGTTNGNGDGGTSSSSSSSGGSSGALTDTTQERCVSLCVKYDPSQAGGEYLQCGPDMFARAPGQYQCKELCEHFGPRPDATTPCGQKLAAFVNCALPAACDPQTSGSSAPTPDSCSPMSCPAKIDPCNPGEVTSACAEGYRMFLESKGLDPDAGAKKNAQVECNKVCTKQNTGGCPMQDCALGCALYSSRPQTCQDAYIKEAECFLAAPNVCTAACTAEVQARIAACM